jgi:uncharacterized repeat protein (TIGR01451 family)
MGADARLNVRSENNSAWRRLGWRLWFALSLSAAILSGVAIVIADPASPVTISDVDTPDPVASGAQITHSITIVNTGGAKISNVVMSDQLNGVGGIGVPPQLQIASSRGSCQQSGTLVTCNGGTIEGNGVWVISIRGLVTAPNGTVLNNTVSVTGTKSAQNFTTTNTTTTLVSNGGGSNLPELSINKTGPTSVVLASPMTYTLTVNNTGTQNATGIRVVDTLPAGVTFVSAAPTSLFVCSLGLDGQTVTCDDGAVNQGSNATITINATSPAVIPTPAFVTNTAVVDPDNTIAESNELNNTSALVNTQITNLPEPPALSINITDDPAVISGAGPSDPVVPGAGLTYKILATNNAATRADDVVIVLGTQNLEASSVIVSQVVTNGAVGNSGGCTNVSPQARCVVRSLNPGGTIEMTVSGYVIGSAGSFMIGTATVTGNIKNKGVTNTDTELTTIMPQFDLTITKADSPDPVCAASWPGPGYPAGVDYPAGNTCQGGLTYTFVIGNSGIDPLGATNVVVRDPLPAGMIFDHAVNVVGFDGGFSCSYDTQTNVVTCTGGAIPAQSIKKLQFVVVAPPGLGQITNTVTVDPNNAIFEADESNNTFTQTTQIATGVDLVVAKHSNHEATFVATRGTLTYTIKVSNLGTQDSTNIHVRDTLPADTIFRDAISDPLHNFSCSQAGGVVDCVAGQLKGTESMNYPNLAGTAVDVATITIRIFATAYEQPAMHNEVRVDPLNQILEVNELNNLAVQNTQVSRGGFLSDAFNELTITKSQTSPLPAANTARNAVVTYVIKVGNEGTDPVVGVKVRDTLPAGARYIEANGTTNNFLCLPQSLTVVDCVGGQIAANTPTTSVNAATITIKAFAPDTPGTYNNQVEVDPDHAIAEGNEFNNNALAETIVTNGGVGAFHELKITKTLTAPTEDSVANPIARNAIVTYTLVVENDGSDGVNDITVLDFLPTGSRFISATAPPATQFLCSEGEGAVECVGGQVAGSGPGDTATITVKIFAPDTPGTYTNQALVDPGNDIPEGNEQNNADTEDVVIVNGGIGDYNDLSISKSGPASVTPNAAITYSLTVSNTEGSNAALNVKVRDVLSSLVTFVSASDVTGSAGAFTCSQSSFLVTCTGGTIAAGGSRTIQIKVTAPNLTDVTLLNQALVDPENDIPEGDEENNTDDFETTVGSNINLSILKGGPHTSSQNQVTSYKLTIKNHAPGGVEDNGAPALGVVVHDPLPIGLIPLDYDTGSNNNFACQFSENPINLFECLGDLNPEQEVVIELKVFMTAETGRSLDNEACIDPADVIKEFSTGTPPSVTGGETDNCSTHTSLGGAPPKRSPDFLISKSVEAVPPISPAEPGTTLNYTITLSNVGDAKAVGPITVTDNLPNQTTAVNITGPGLWTCSAPADVMTCTSPGASYEVNPGDTLQFAVEATVNDGANAPLVNTATVSAANADPGETDAEDEKIANLGNNSTSVTTAVGGTGLDLSIGSITDNPDPVNSGKLVSYTVVAVNGGTLDAPSAVVRVTLPSNSAAMFVAADGTNGFNCADPGILTVFDCIGDLPAGGNTVITVKLIVVLAVPGDLVLSATIDPDDAFDESEDGNNTQSETTTVSGSVCTNCVDLVSVLLSASPEPITSGTVTFKYILVNAGDLPASLSSPPSPALAWFDFVANPASAVDPPPPGSGAIGGVTFTFSEPSGFSCTTVSSAANFKNNDCFGTLGPGQGITITATLTGVGGDDLTASATADPSSAITEFNEGNNQLTETVVIQ